MAEHETIFRRAAVATLGNRRTRQLGRVKTSAIALSRNSFTARGRANARRIEAYRDTHAGETCVIIGNGPSLNDTNLETLRDVPTFGLNRIYLMSEKLGFVPTYHVVVNRHVVDQCADELRAVTSPLFTTAENTDRLPAGADVLALNSLVGPRFSSDLKTGVWQGATVTYVAMQIAHHMGFQRVVLVGVDHNFTTKGPPHKLVESSGADPNHFDPGYFGKGFKWQLPDLDTSEIAYRLARAAFEREGREIIDSTVGGKLEVFPKWDLVEALG